MNWISVEDRLPAYGESVLAYKLGNILVRKYSGRRGWSWFNEDGYSTRNINNQEEQITHWMPLPDPPETKDG